MSEAPLVGHEKSAAPLLGLGRATLHTLGCRLNQSETDRLAGLLQQAGYELVDFQEEADLAIINTCTVTSLAESKGRQAIRGFVRRNPQAYVAVVGCYAQTGPEAVAALEGVDLVLGNHDKFRVLEYIGEGTRQGAARIVRERIQREAFSLPVLEGGASQQRTNLKVQDGCDFFCTFCIIPFARGRARAREFENLCEEARRLVAGGARELVLTGVNIGTYEQAGRSLLEVVDALHAMEGLWRIRIGSIEPTTVDEGLLARMADASHKLVPYLHLPLQSGCDRILAAMKRKYSLEEYAQFVAEAQAQVPGLCLGTDMLVGFPGESEEEFEASCRFFLEQPFRYVHVFTYSERAGTPAAKAPEPVPVPERQRRSAVLRNLSKRKREAWYEGCVGETVEVLVEARQEQGWSGYTEDYRRVLIRHDGALADRLVRVRLEGVEGDYLLGSYQATLA